MPHSEIGMHLDEPSKDKNKLLDCSPLSPSTSKSSFLFRSNSLIQENTIEEVDENSKSALELALSGHDTLDTCAKETLETIAIPNVDSSSKEYESKEESISDSKSTRIPLPPCEKTAKDNNMASEIVPHNEHCENELKKPEQLMIIEEGDDVNITANLLENKKSEILIYEINKAEATLEEPTILKESSIEEASTDIREINFKINKSSLSAFDEEEDTCEHILDETETEVVFEIPDYVNVTSPPIPPRPVCENLSM